MSGLLEIFAVAALVGLEGALAFAVLASAQRPAFPRSLRAATAAALAAGLGVGVALELAARGRGLALGDVAPDLHRLRHVHALALLAAALLVRGRGGAELAAGRARPLAETGALAAALGILLPEGAFLAGRVRDAAFLAGAPAPALLGAGAGLALAAAAGWALAAGMARARPERWLTPAAALAVLLALELAGIGASAVEAHQLPGALTGVVSRAVHDAAHLVFVMLQVPDHAYLEDAAYQLILRFLEPELHAILTAAALAAPIVAAAGAFLGRAPDPVPPEARAPARRVARAAHVRRSWAGAAPFVVALAVAGAAVWQARPGADELYLPIPQPVVDDGAGTVVVPLGGPLGGDDGRMRKWVYAARDRSVTFFTVRRPDGSLAAALDLCEICQPKGYAQMGAAHVFCIYCKTPIPVGTVGQPGGCNPVPVPSAVRGGMLLVPRDALLAAYERAMADKR